jgi:hypothetical protein
MIWILFIVNNKAYNSRRKIYLEVVNESLSQLITYTFLLYTDFVSDLEMRYRIGWVTISLIILLVCVNVYEMIARSIRTCNANKAKKKKQLIYQDQWGKVIKIFKDNQ